MKRGEQVQALLGLGANLGEREGQLRRVLRRVEETAELRLAHVSGLYETMPEDCPEGSNDYLNAAIVVDVTDWGADDLLRWCLTTEQEAGRERTSRNAPRTLDIDVLLFGAEVIESSGLKVPHPRLHKRGFVLVPSVDVAADWMHPLLGKTVRDLLYALGETRGVSRVASLEWADAISHSSR